MKPGDSSSPEDVPRILDASAIEEEAAAWLVRRQAGFVDNEEIRFQAWLLADPRCRTAFEETERTWDVMCYPAKTNCSEEARQELLKHHHTLRRIRWATAGIGLAAAIVVMVVFQSQRSAILDPSPPAAVAVRPDRIVLPDGSIIERNAGTDVEVDYSAQTRRVRLLRGEALFTVAKDASRPFLVNVGEVEVRAVGTEFSVRFEPSLVNVLVTQGEVAVTKLHSAGIHDAGDASPRTSPPVVTEPVYLRAGKQVVMPTEHPLLVAPQITPMGAEQIAAALAWRGNRVEFTRTALAQVVELFNRQNPLQLSVEDARTKEIRITGLYWIDDPEGFVRLLEAGFEVRAARSEDVISLRSGL